MSYSVFRIEGVKNIGSLKGLSKHNKDRISNTNPDIDKSKSYENIDLIECDGTYNKKFNDITKDMREQHDERMKTMRADRVRSFDKSLDDSSSDVACEMIFTSDEKFFEKMNREDIIKWAKCSLDFVTEDIGLKKENIIHAVVHMDEKTPHLHVVAVPLVEAYDGRRKQNTLQISRAKYIKGGKHLTKLQDIYNERMNKNGYKLERGEIGSLKVHQKTEDYKKKQVKEVIKKLDINKLKLAGTIKEVEAKYETLVKTKSCIADIEAIETKKSLIGGNIILKEGDFNKLKGLAIEGIHNKDKNNHLLRENTELKQRVSDGSMRIDELRSEKIIQRKELNKLKIVNKAYESVARDHGLIGEVEKAFKELVKPKDKARSKTRDWDRER